MKSTKKILGHVQQYAFKYLEGKLSPELGFHNLNHTVEVTLCVREIAENLNVSDEELSVVQVAAWFHDFGYSKTYIGHEDFSKATAKRFLKNHAFPKTLITRVLDCIEATRFPQTPHSLEAMILCDADLYHLTKPGYPRYEEALRKELSVFLNKHYTDTEWKEANCSMLATHQYFTDYGRNVLQKFKEVNLAFMRCK
jgi:predicted metal-dependent HD superfamily phosphohydrolase